MLRTVGVIPARGGSKGIIHKNICDLAGKPLIAYTIEAALRSKTLGKVIVSTDDPKIAKVANSYGAEVPFLRPTELAKDDTPGFLVVQHAVKRIEEAEDANLDVVVLLQPTSPLRSHIYIDEAVQKLLETGADSVVTVCKVRHHPFWCFTIEGDRLHPFSKRGINVSRHQDLPEIYAVNGAVYAINRDSLFKYSSVFGKDTRAVIMPYEESIDIDAYFDFFVAEMMLKHWKGWMNERSKDWK